MSLSSKEANSRAISQVSTKLAWIKSLLIEVKVSWYAIPVVWCDNISLGSLDSDVVFHSRMKHIEIYVHFVR